MRISNLVVGLVLVIGFPGKILPQDKKDCTASFNGTEMVIRNNQIERRWRLVKGHLYATSILGAKASAQWLTGVVPDVKQSATGHREYLFTSRWVKSAVERPALVVELRKEGELESGYRFRIFPDAAAVSIQLLGKAAGEESRLSKSTAVEASGIESDRVVNAKLPNDLEVDALERFPLSSQHLKLTQVELYDQTDIHNELVHERSWLLQRNESVTLSGNLFTLENSLTGNGLVFLKEAPLPHARPEKSELDFRFDGPRNTVGLEGEPVGPEGAGYRFTTLVYTGGQPGVTRALHEYQRQIRPYVAGRDGMFISNTWGDRSRDARINDAFMRGEVEAGARLGVDAIQIDDGWQQGRTKNSATAGGVWNGFWAADANFWDVNRKRFPKGLEPVIAMARNRNMSFGLWFAPDSSNDFANWQKDADRLLELNRTIGINYFKIDGVKATSKMSEVRLQSFFDRVLKNSDGRIVFDLDVTAEIRPGYFGAMNVGPLFVENRYTDFHGYWPHQTLRNLWSLARYVDPLRLRVEFLNNTRNQKLYAGDPLAPKAYAPAYLFATTMMANPLGWFENSGLPGEYFKELPPLVRTWKKERERMQVGQIFPIGNEPDGVAWTGFLSLDQKSSGGYLLAFRESNGAAEWSSDADGLLQGDHKLTLLAGTGSGLVTRGRVSITIPKPLDFAWFRIESTR